MTRERPAAPAPDMPEALPYVSRAGLKLAFALRELDVSVQGLVCADFGANVGGFTDCLLQHGAAQAYAIDTGYGTLAYTLRTDPRVVVLERTNALHAPPPAGGVELVTIDLAWTRQRLSIPAALRWLRPGGRIVTLVKPHYELTAQEKRALLVNGRLDAAAAQRVLARALDAMPEAGARPLAVARSPLTGAKSARKGAGNVEYVVLCDRQE